MIKEIFQILDSFNNMLWGYVGVILILAIGTYLSCVAKWIQIFKFPKILYNFFSSIGKSGDHHPDDRGVAPIKVFFASIGGCVGVGNIATVAVAVQIGGPGALVWVWAVALLGMIIKYSEIFLGLKYRVINAVGGFNGGPMYFLQKAFKNEPWVSVVMSVLLGIYGVEIYMFRVVKESVVINWSLPSIPVTIALLVMIIVVVQGGVKRVGSISSVIIPIFVLFYLLMTFYVLVVNYEQIPSLFATIFQSAFTGHAAVGGFAGSTFFLTVAKGIAAASYSGDIGIGYASIIHSEARTTDPKHQASLSIFGIFLDAFIICTCTILLLLVTGAWQDSVDGSVLVQNALAQYFPFMEFFMPVFLFILGYSTIIAYMCAGIKCAQFLSPKYGERLYYIYGIGVFLLFSFFHSYYALIIMSISGGLLMLINLSGIFRLRKEIDYRLN